MRNADVSPVFLTINGGRLWRQKFCRRERSLSKCTREVTICQAGPVSSRTRASLGLNDSAPGSLQRGDLSLHVLIGSTVVSHDAHRVQPALQNAPAHTDSVNQCRLSCQ